MYVCMYPACAMNSGDDLTKYSDRDHSHSLLMKNANGLIAVTLLLTQLMQIFQSEDHQSELIEIQADHDTPTNDRIGILIQNHLYETFLYDIKLYVKIMCGYGFMV